MNIDCDTCGGSGGGGGYYRCPTCRGSGMIYVDPEHYGQCALCEDLFHEEELSVCEDNQKFYICDGCKDEHKKECPSCGCAFFEGVDGRLFRFCSEQCADDWS